ncbi:hypothetical protein UFOVP46_112 [uncultured Caudovirales phage]|uniref:Uncharacterized protein n=1 Tax=uncultured Caudovirales phage TaxID=2100421 RepID=A0A6J5KNB1_9CAUD|nr:hypothetical protein UFOVP46_112 [uncultured Caudovirales phage]
MTISSIDQYHALAPKAVSNTSLSKEQLIHMDKLAGNHSSINVPYNQNPSTGVHLSDLGKFVNPTASTSNIPSWAAKTSGNKDSTNVFGGKVLAEYAESYSLNMDANGAITYDIQITQDKFARLLEGRSHMEKLDTSFLEEQLANYDDQLDKDFIKGYLAAIEVLNERKYLEDYLPE